MKQQNDNGFTSAIWQNRLKSFKIMGFVILVVTSALIFKSGIISGEVAKNGDLRILKREVTSTAKFYPYTAGGVKMEVIAVRASDRSIRTALNTCQVCYDSGRGFYTQQGDESVCNNCGNRFKIDQLEKIKYGCNPIPILKEDKIDDGKYIRIAKAFLTKNVDCFRNWKK